MKRCRLAFISSIHLMLFLIISACASNTTNDTKTNHSEGLDRFDTIVPQALKTAGLMDSNKFSFNIVKHTDERHYVVRYLIPAKDDLKHWIVAVSVAPAGKYIDIAKYEETQKAFPKGFKPIMGKRFMDVDIMNVPTDFAPPGMFSGMAYTTPDGKYDVRILLSDLLPKDSIHPKFDWDSVGRKILELYNKE